MWSGGGVEERWEGWWRDRGRMEGWWRGRKKQKREGGRMEKSNLVIFVSRPHLGDEKDNARKQVIIYIHTW